MIYRFFTLLLCATGLFLSTTTAAQGVRRVSHQAFVTTEASSVRFNIDPSLIEVRSTKGSRVMVETNIHMNVKSMPLLDFAIGTGRYELESEMQGSILVIKPKERTHPIMMKGEPVEETVTYILFMPEGIEQKNTDQTAAN